MSSPTSANHLLTLQSPKFSADSPLVGSVGDPRFGLLPFPQYLTNTMQIGNLALMLCLLLMCTQAGLREVEACRISRTNFQHQLVEACFFFSLFLFFFLILPSFLPGANFPLLGQLRRGLQGPDLPPALPSRGAAQGGLLNDLHGALMTHLSPPLSVNDESDVGDVRGCKGKDQGHACGANIAVCHSLPL